jgi:GTP cyclohydrolase I
MNSNGKNGKNGNNGTHTDTLIHDMIGLEDRPNASTLDKLSLSFGPIPVSGYDSRKSAIEDSIRDVLLNIGEDPDRDGLLKTPHRVAKCTRSCLPATTPIRSPSSTARFSMSITMIP